MRIATAKSLAAIAALAASLPAQNRVPNGDFERGAAGWSLTQFNDTAGTTGFAAARTTGNGPSMAVYADFKTLTPVMSATYRSGPISLPPVPLAVTYNVMFEKQVTTPIPSVSANRVELRIFDSTNTRVFLGQTNAPNQTGYLERASYSNTFTVPAAGVYTVEVFLRHSNLANMPFILWVDDVALGSPNSVVFGTGCQGSGGFVPVLNSVNVPSIGSTDYKIEVHDAFSPTAGAFVLDGSNTQWGPLKLPFAYGGGCSIHVGPTLVGTAVVLGTGAGKGKGSMTLPIPNDQMLVGLQLYGQWYVADPAVKAAFALASTAGIGFRIQP